MVSRNPAGDGFCYRLKDVSYHSKAGIAHTKKALLYSDDPQIPIGSVIRSTGPVQGYLPGHNDGNFNFYLYYKSQKILFSQYAEQIQIINKPRFFIQESISRLRAALTESITGSMNESDAGILCAMLLGDRSLMEDASKTAYQEHGISHILAISGLHISMFGMTCFVFLRKRVRCPLALCAGVSAAVVILFVVMSGMSVSAVRAMIMFLFYLGAKLSGRTYDGITAMGYAAVLILFCNPLAILQNGFLLSFGAVGSIAMVLPVMKRILPTPAGLETGKYLYDLLDSARLSLSVWIGLTPMTAAMFYYVPLYSVLLNLIVIPCCSVLLGTGLLGCVTGLFFPDAANYVFLPAHYILGLFDLQMRAVDRLPSPTLLTGHVPVPVLVLFYMALAVVCIRRIWEYQRAEKAGSKSRIRQAGRKCRIRILLPLVLLGIVLWNPKQDSFRVDFLDVGQGDGISISTPEGRHFMIDGGSTSEKKIGPYRLLPFLRYHKIGKVDLWIVTHTDEDHVSGLLEVLENGYPVDTILFAEAAKSDEMTDMILAAAKRNHTRIAFSKKGTAYREDHLTFACLYPEASESISDKNDLSQVWLLNYDGWRFLFTGDLGEEPEQILCGRNILSDIDILKVGHHGSNYSSSETFLSQLKPEYAVISVGRDNRYHHPGPDALKRLHEAGCHIYMTMESGQISFYERKGNRYVRCRFDQTQEETPQ